MSRFSDPARRRELAVAAAMALAAIAATAWLRTPYIATCVLPGAWLALQARGRHRCTRRRPAPP